MISPKGLEDIACFIEQSGKQVLFFSADWCGDCRYIQSFLADIEQENPDFSFMLVDRDQYIDLAKKWDIYGIPSLLVLENGCEIARFVNRERKTKLQINDFLSSIR